MQQKGFTLIELLVVLVVLAIITSVSVTAYTKYQDRAADSSVRSAASSLKSGLERYYNRNNEYPSAATLFGGTPTGAIASNPATTTTLIDISRQSLTDSRIKFVPCSGSVAGCTPINPPVNGNLYYYTKTTASGTAQSYSYANCTYTFAAGDPPNAAFFIGFKSLSDNKWLVAKSNNGTLTNDPVYCPLTAL